MSTAADEILIKPMHPDRFSEIMASNPVVFERLESQKTPGAYISYEFRSGKGYLIDLSDIKQDGRTKVYEVPVEPESPHDFVRQYMETQIAPMSNREKDALREEFGAFDPIPVVDNSRVDILGEADGCHYRTGEPYAIIENSRSPHSPDGISPASIALYEGVDSHGRAVTIMSDQSGYPDDDHYVLSARPADPKAFLEERLKQNISYCAGPDALKARADWGIPVLQEDREVLALWQIAPVARPYETFCASRDQLADLEARAITGDKAAREAIPLATRAVEIDSLRLLKVEPSTVYAMPPADQRIIREDAARAVNFLAPQTQNQTQANARTQALQFSL